jgi:hypothetical protein
MVDGGTVGCVTMTVDTAPSLTRGAQYVFVLTPAIDADNRRLGDAQAVYMAWAIDATGTVQTTEGPLSAEALAGKVADAGKP